MGDSKPGTRVLIFSGKGGVGKTTTAAATGLRTAALGQRTIILSVDVAHSLADAFDATARLVDHPTGDPYPVAPNLEIQELDVQTEVTRHWDEVFGYFFALFSRTGMDDLMAEEIALIPGMEDVIALLYLNEYVKAGAHDVIILDLAPTGESLRFVSMPNTLDWYMRKVFKFERRLAKLVRPVAKRLAEVPLPEDSYFEEIQQLWNRMEGVDKVLLDPQRTSVRLVTNAETMVVRETERAHMYFSLYGMTVDGVVANRILDIPSDQIPAQLKGWVDTQERNLERLRRDFSPLVVDVLPLQDDEVVGLERLERLATALYGPLEGGRDPAARSTGRAPYAFSTKDGQTTLSVFLPGLDPKNLEVLREAETLVLRIGSQKRHLSLPRRLYGVAPTRTQYRDDTLHIHF